VGYHAKADAGLGRHLDFFKPKMMFIIFLCVKKLLDNCVIFLVQFVPDCLFFYILIMQQSWAGQA
jgi:hypothetical protein